MTQSTLYMHSLVLQETPSNLSPLPLFNRTWSNPTFVHRFFSKLEKLTKLNIIITLTKRSSTLCSDCTHTYWNMNEEYERSLPHTSIQQMLSKHPLHKFSSTLPRPSPIAPWYTLHGTHTTPYLKGECPITAGYQEKNKTPPQRIVYLYKITTIEFHTVTYKAITLTGNTY